MSSESLNLQGKREKLIFKQEQKLRTYSDKKEVKLSVLTRVKNYFNSWLNYFFNSKNNIVEDNQADDEYIDKNNRKNFSVKTEENSIEEPREEKRKELLGQAKKLAEEAKEYVEEKERRKKEVEDFFSDDEIVNKSKETKKFSKLFSKMDTVIEQEGKKENYDETIDQFKSELKDFIRSGNLTKKSDEFQENSIDQQMEKNSAYLKSIRQQKEAEKLAEAERLQKQQASIEKNKSVYDAVIRELKVKIEDEKAAEENERLLREAEAKRLAEEKEKLDKKMKNLEKKCEKQVTEINKLEMQKQNELEKTNNLTSINKELLEKSSLLSESLQECNKIKDDLNIELKEQSEESQKANELNLEIHHSIIDYLTKITEQAKPYPRLIPSAVTIATQSIDHLLTLANPRTHELEVTKNYTESIKNLTIILASLNSIKHTASPVLIKRNSIKDLKIEILPNANDKQSEKLLLETSEKLDAISKPEINPPLNRNQKSYTVRSNSIILSRDLNILSENYTNQETKITSLKSEIKNTLEKNSELESSNIQIREKIDSLNNQIKQLSYSIKNLSRNSKNNRLMQAKRHILNVRNCNYFIDNFIKIYEENKNKIFGKNYDFKKQAYDSATTIRKQLASLISNYVLECESNAEVESIMQNCKGNLTALDNLIYEINPINTEVFESFKNLKNEQNKSYFSSEDIKALTDGYNQVIDRYTKSGRMPKIKNFPRFADKQQFINPIIKAMAELYILSKKEYTLDKDSSLNAAKNKVMADIRALPTSIKNGKERKTTKENIQAIRKLGFSARKTNSYSSNNFSKEIHDYQKKNIANI